MSENESNKFDENLSLIKSSIEDITVKTTLFVCPICSRKLKTQEGFEKHLDRHNSPGGYKCSYCESGFCTRSLLNQHIKEVHGIFQCDICDKYFETADVFTHHVRNDHNGELMIYHVCERCGKQFGTEIALNRHHEANCGTTKKYKCDQCNKYYLSKFTLAAHKMGHTGQKFYCCSYCGMQFLSQGQLKVHEPKHTKAKPFECNVCGKRFPYRESLVTHSSIHTGVKPFICENCRKTFSCIGNLQKHRRSRPDSCGHPQFCQKFKRIAPRTRTKTYIKKIKPSSIVKSSEEDTQDMTVEYLNENPFDEESDDNDLEERSIDSFNMGNDNANDCLNESSTQVQWLNDSIELEKTKETETEVQQFSIEDDLNSNYEIITECNIEIIDTEQDDPIEVNIQLAESDDNFEDGEEFILQSLEIDEATLSAADIDNYHKPFSELEIDLTNSHLSDLIVSDTNEDLYECLFCCLDFHLPKLLMDHLLSTHRATDEEIEQHFPETEGNLKCPYCSKIFHLQLLFAKHLQSHAENISHYQEKTKDEILLDHSMTKEKPVFVCTKCNRLCPSNYLLKQHEQSDCGKMAKFKCDICNKDYHSQGSLKMHQSVHTGLMPFVCSVCGKRFRTKGQHVSHSRKHTGERPFECNICFKAFSHRQSLLTHITVHTGEKPYYCQCGQSFSCINNLKSHRSTFSATCGRFPLVTKPVIQIGVKKGQLYVGGKAK